MAKWFMYFILYSFLGYLLEKAYALTTHSAHQVRKCFLLLPLCPVYGLAMTALIALTEGVRNLPVLIVIGALVCTGTEYLVHWFYDRVFHVRFWDYRDMPGNIRGRICPQFALAWGFLSAAALRWLQPVVAALTVRLPEVTIYVLWLILAADCVLTAAVLRQFQDTERLALTTMIGQIRASSQSNTSR